MKKNLLLISALFLGLFSTNLNAQSHGACGTVVSEEMTNRLISNRDRMYETATNRSDEVTYVPIKFHLTANTDGTGRIQEKKVFDQLCALNAFYDPYDIQFFIKGGFSYINHTSAYASHSSEGGQIQLAAKREKEMLNVFICKDAGDSNIPGGTILGYYTPSPLEDWIVIRKTEVNAFSGTLMHEIGHYFSLHHPFHGWDSNPWDAAIHGNPVDLPDDYAPTFTDVKIEYVDGTNCLEAGDFLCDTPPSYLFFTWNGCNYAGGCMDPNGDLVDPDEMNMMDYFDDSCTPKHFSDDQVAVVMEDMAYRTSLPSSSPGYIEIETNSTVASISDVPQLVNPEHMSTVEGENLVVFDWTPVDGATKYLFEIAKNSSFVLSFQSFIVNGTHKVMEDEDYFDPSTEYFWRVRPFNEYYTCTELSEKGSFTTGTTVLSGNNDITFINEWTLQPNPVYSDESLTIMMESEKAFDAKVNLYNIAGQLIRTIENRFSAGSSTFAFSSLNVEAGMYIISMETAEGVTNKKVIVQGK